MEKIAVALGFMFPVMSTIYNLWGFVMPYIAARVLLTAKAIERFNYLRTGVIWLYSLSNRWLNK